MRRLQQRIAMVLILVRSAQAALYITARNSTTTCTSKNTHGTRAPHSAASTHARVHSHSARTLALPLPVHTAARTSCMLGMLDTYTHRHSMHCTGNAPYRTTPHHTPHRTALLHCTALHRTAPHRTTTALHPLCTAPCRSAARRVAPRCAALRRVAPHCAALRRVARRCVALIEPRCVALRCVASLRCVALRRVMRWCVAVRLL